MFSQKVLEIPNTLKLLSTWWIEAEKSLRDDVNNIYPEADEEFITKFFHGKYSAVLKIVSEMKLIEKAFLDDLRNAFPDLNVELNKIANGLIAEFSLHNLATERITGGDIGLLIIRPNILQEDNYLKVFDHRSGLLCQAKLKNSRGSWGLLTKNQINRLQDKLSYLTLLLYSYRDLERRSLNPFKWKDCNSAKNINEVQEWLKKDKFTDLLKSDDIILKLGYDKIGTNNDEVIDRYISPEKNPVLIIRVTWTDKKPPLSKVHIVNKNSVQRRQKVQIYLNG